MSPFAGSFNTGKKNKKNYATFATEEHHLRPERPRRIRKATWLSRLMFAFAQPLLETGSQRQLNTHDLWELDRECRTDVAYTTFKQAYTQHSDANMLHAAIAKTYAWPLAWCGLGASTTEACAVFAPVVLHRVIDLFASPSSLDMDSLVYWVALFFVSRLVNGFAYAHTKFNVEMVLLQLTSSLKALLFEKTMRRSISNESEIDVTNLLTADMDSVVWAGSQLHALWIMPIQVAVVMVLLFNVLEMAAFAGLSVIFVSITANYVVAKQYNAAFRDIMKVKDTRMAQIKEVFTAIQIVKLNAWETPFLNKIRKSRATEMAAIAKYLYLNGLSIFLFWSVPLCVSVASFAAYALVLGKTLTAAKVFTAMVLFNAIREPLAQFPEAVQSLLQARAALERMAKYLATDEVAVDCVTRGDDSSYASDVEIVVENVTLCWRKSEAVPVLSNANFQIRKGDFVVVHGAVGAGKSSLCAALIGELPSEQGKVFVRSHEIAYYSQQPWIQNMTIRDNILFGLPFDKTKYDRVVDACGLVKDLTMFPAGDATEIGQKGVNLSGGQKARVSLARACYADADVYILDSPLAAVDAIVQAEIFNKCLCGLLENKTVVLVTHLHDIIESKAANVKILIEDGEVSVKYADRLKSRRAYANLYASERVDSQIEPMASQEYPPAGQLIAKEECRVGDVSSTVYKAYVDAIGGPKMIMASVVIIVSWQSFQVASDIWLSDWTSATDSGADPDPKSVPVASSMAVYALLGLGASVFLLLRSLIMAYLGMAAARRLFDDMTQSLLHAPLRFFDTNPIGRILNRYAEDMSTIDFRLPFAVFRLLVASAVNIFQLLAAVYVIQWAGLLIIPLAFVYMRVGFFYLATFRQVARMAKAAKSPVLSHVSQSRDGVVVLRAFGQSFIDRAIAENFQLNDASNRAWFAQAAVSQWFGLRVQMVGFGVVVLVVSTLVVFHELMSPGLVGLAFMYAVSIDIRLSWWLQSWSSLEAAMVSTERIVMYCDLPSEGSPSDRLVVTSGSPRAVWPQTGGISFEKVKFAYKPGGDLVLRGLSFQIQHNEKIGIVGRTGAGKSSLTLALFRINELVGGRIMLDGVDISTVNLQKLRSSMSIIPQVPVLFKGSMRAYMDPFEEYSDAEIWVAFEKGGLKDMISALDGKLQHELSENGENFSVGERQMLCLARALLRKSRIVVMDEATASIDRATEQKLQAMIQREFVDATVVTIAHRLTSVLESDRIMVLSDGKVVEFDTPHNLARIEGGVFREFAEESGCLPILLMSSSTLHTSFVAAAAWRETKLHCSSMQLGHVQPLPEARPTSREISGRVLSVLPSPVSAATATAAATHSLNVQGKYSIERLLALEEYSRTKSYWHVLAVILWTPLPPFVILTYQLPRLAPPATGWQANWVYIVVRGGIGTMVICECCLTMTRTIIPELDAVLPLSKRLLYDGFSGVLYMLLIVAFAHVWGFPVPFTSSLINPIVGISNIITLYMAVRSVVSKSHDLQRRFMICCHYTGVISFVSLLYPAYMALFFTVGTHSRMYQPVVTLLAPLIKLLLRRIMAHATREWEDLVPVMVIFSVEFFNSLYQVICVQTGSSTLTTGTIMALDVVFTIHSQWRLHHHTRSLRQMLQQTATTSASDGLLTIVSAACDDPQSLQASSVEEIHRLRAIRLYSALDHSGLSMNGRQRLAMVDRAGVFASAKSIQTTQQLASRNSSRRRATTLGSVFATRVYPVVLVPATTVTHANASIAPSHRTAWTTRKSSDQIIVSSQHTQSSVVVEATNMLFRTELLVLGEYLECIIPLLYAANMVLLWLSPNGAYYPHTGAIRNLRELLVTLLNIAALFTLEVASFVVLNVVLRKRLQFPPLHQLSYVLEHQATVIRANILVILVMSLEFNLVHAGADFSFQFRWLRNGNASG